VVLLIFFCLVATAHEVCDFPTLQPWFQHGAEALFDDDYLIGKALLRKFHHITGSSMYILTLL
jgi:hypothetical protein